MPQNFVMLTFLQPMSHLYFNMTQHNSFTTNKSLYILGEVVHMRVLVNLSVVKAAFCDTNC